MSSSSSLMHIRGVQPSKAKNNLKRKPQVPIPPQSRLFKNITKIITNKRKTNLQSPSFGINNIMDQKCFSFYMDNFINNNQLHQHIKINTQECNAFLNKHNVTFISERTQEISNSKVLITLNATPKRNNATFLIKLPAEYNEMLILLILIKIDFGDVQVEFSQNIGRLIKNFIHKAKCSGFQLYFDFIRLNILNKRFIIMRN